MLTEKEWGNQKLFSNEKLFGGNVWNGKWLPTNIALESRHEDIGNKRGGNEEESEKFEGGNCKPPY